MSSHFGVVQAIFKAYDETDVQPLVEALDMSNIIGYEDYDDDLEELARSLFYVLSRAFKGMQPEAYKEFREKLTDRAVDEEIELIFWEESDG